MPVRSSWKNESEGRYDSLRNACRACERGIAREDQLGRIPAEGRHDLVGPGADQGVTAVGLVAQEIVDEEVTRGAIQPRIEMQRALPPPDVEVGVGPDRRTPGQVAPHRPQDDPLSSPFVPDRQLLRGNAQVVARLDEQRATDRREQGDRRARREDAAWVERPGLLLRPDRKRGPGARPNPPSGTATAIATPGDRQQVVMLPVQAREGDLEPRRTRSSRRPRRRRASAGLPKIR